METEPGEVMERLGGLGRRRWPSCAAIGMEKARERLGRVGWRGTEGETVLLLPLPPERVRSGLKGGCEGPSVRGGISIGAGNADGSTLIGDGYISIAGKRDDKRKRGRTMVLRI